MNDHDLYPFITEKQRNDFIEDVLDLLVQNGGPQAVSVMQANMRGSMSNSSHTPTSRRIWRLPGNLRDFENYMRWTGFGIREGRNERNQKRTEVYVK